MFTRIGLLLEWIRDKPWKYVAKPTILLVVFTVACFIVFFFLTTIQGWVGEIVVTAFLIPLIEYTIGIFRWASDDLLKWTWVIYVIWVLAIITVGLYQTIPYTRRGYLIALESKPYKTNHVDNDNWGGIEIISRIIPTAENVTVSLISVLNSHTNEIVFADDIQLTWSGENPPPHNDHRHILTRDRHLKLDVVKTYKNENKFYFTTLIEKNSKLGFGAGNYQFKFVVRGDINGKGIHEFEFLGNVVYRNDSNIEIDGKFTNERIWIMTHEKK